MTLTFEMTKSILREKGQQYDPPNSKIIFNKAVID